MLVPRPKLALLELGAESDSIVALAGALSGGPIELELVWEAAASPTAAATSFGDASSTGLAETGALVALLTPLVVDIVGSDFSWPLLPPVEDID